jgi:hypothetical protein
MYTTLHRQLKIEHHEPYIGDTTLCSKVCKTCVSYESEFLQKLEKDEKIHEARAFNFTYRYIYDVLSINNFRFAE